jgi:acetyl esterase/lipase
MLNHMTISQSRYLNPSTGARYTSFCKTKAITPETIRVETSEGTTVAAHWLGRSDAERVILYLHGGGYTQAANEGNFVYAARLHKDLNSTKQHGSVAVLLVEYTLVPEATYPTQLKEAAAVLAHLIADHAGSGAGAGARRPSDIFVSGDSAGGNLAMSLLSHLLHPHPHVPAVHLQEPLGGALLYSPWVSFSTDYPSFDNLLLDVLPPLVLRKWSAMFLNKANPSNPEADPGPIAGDAYTEAAKNPASWWEGMHSVCSHVLVAYGSSEVLVDAIEELEAPLKKGWAEGGGDASAVVFLKGAKEAHIAPIVDIMAPGADVKSSTQTAVEAWYKARLRD